MKAMQWKSLDDPDERLPFPKGMLEMATVGEVKVMRASFEPGWSWSECVKPLVGGDSCDVHHVGYVISGRLGFRMDDGEEAEFGPGDVYVVPPGHDTWVVGDEPCVGLNFTWFESARAGTLEEIRERMRAAARDVDGVA